MFFIMSRGFKPPLTHGSGAFAYRQAMRYAAAIRENQKQYRVMDKNRLEAFSDGVIAVIITLMVLELKAPATAASLADLKGLAPAFASYVLSFIYVGIYWSNHHHMFQTTTKVTGGILWANLHLLFWLSLLPFTTAWVSQNRYAPIPSATYGFVLLLAALAYYILQSRIIADQGQDSLLAAAIGNDWKGKFSPVCYFAAIPLAFVSPWIANGLYAFVALMWLVPDRRIERMLTEKQVAKGPRSS
jgi:uncharacterized membrane protein